MANSFIKYIGTAPGHQESATGRGGVQIITCAPGEIISVPADIATSLVATEPTVWAAATDPSTASKHLATISTLQSTAVVAGGAGTSPPAPVITGDDSKGLVTWGTGTSPATGAQVTVTFNTPYVAGTTPRTVISPANAATAALVPYVIQQGQAGFQVALQVIPAASQANTVYAVTYVVIG